LTTVTLVLTFFLGLISLLFYMWSRAQEMAKAGKFKRSKK